MSGGLIDSGRHAIRIGLTTMFAGGLCVGCGGARTESPAVSPLAQDGVVQCPDSGPPTTRAELRACVARDTFDTNELVGDEQRLMVNPPCPDSCRYGPLAKIEPTLRAHQYSDDDFRKGRIIARLFVRRDQKGYPKLALVPGYMTYWWVQKDPRARSGTSLYISEAMVGNRLVTQPGKLEVEPYPLGTFKRAIAGWLWLDDDEVSKGTCGSAVCKQ
jgi:hypothetical protein